MSNNTLHKLGIDIGSTTVKVAVLDENDNLLFSDYERHFANIRVEKPEEAPLVYALVTKDGVER